MRNQHEIIRVTPGSELAQLLARAALGPVLLEKEGELYRLDRMEQRTEDIWERYDPDKVKEAIAATTGSWADLEVEAFIRNLYRAREEGSRPPSRP